MKNLLFLSIFILSTGCSKNKSDTVVNNLNKTNTALQSIMHSPYKTFFNTIRINGITDTILVQNRTKVFGCATAKISYNQELKEKGLHTFYEKHGALLDHQEFINRFKKNHNVTILWIDTGNEGDLFQLDDSLLHKNIKLEKHVIESKPYLVFNDTPKSLDSLSITVLIDYKNPKTKLLKTFDLSADQNGWKIDKVYEEDKAN